ncbi:S-adenosyl-L-methionine-dependent methyltransferase [Tothia fuscella]|uniref:S-adenosyl-L-methionine-dependent methyltransferase n=1 Tax=Tothia fuscella TaxID=1048955 RepID=A0A9P4NMH9_9PEZI|nr:S-adenosyl-L-methionine-dependent methyltransferase [Tothia fuscella]
MAAIRIGEAASAPSNRSEYNASPDLSTNSSARDIIEPDSDNDSQSLLSSTRSLRDSVWEYIEENGRTYHAFSRGEYMLPNDEPENERLDVQHWIIRRRFNDKEHFAPLKNPARILDIGTGTGIWACKMGELFPLAEVTGTDLSPIQLEIVPPNVSFLIEDAADTNWGTKPYSFIHTRMLLGSFNDFREIIERSFSYLEPGGYMESQEMYPTLYCDDGTMPKDHAFCEWTRTQDEAAMKLGKPLRIANKLKNWYERAGFVDVKEEVFKMPVNQWPKDPEYKMLGRFWGQMLIEGLQGFSLALFTRAFGWTVEEIEVYLVKVRKAIADKNVHAYHKVYVVYGRKPTPEEQRAKEAKTASKSA